MKRNNIVSWLEKAEVFTRRNSPVMLTGLAIVGVIATAYSAYKAGPRAEKILETYRKDMKDCHPRDKEAKRAVLVETAKELAPVVAPPIIMGGVTIGCMIGSQSISNRRIVALSTAYSLAESSVKNLNSKMEEMLGEKKARAIKDSIMKDKLHADAEKDRKAIESGNFVLPSDGTVLCKDLYSGRLFHSTSEKIQQAIVKCSYNIISEMYISLNDFYAAIDSPELEPTPMGDDFGWNIEDTLDGQLPITLTAILTKDNKPCLCVDYDVWLRAELRNLH